MLPSVPFSERAASVPFEEAKQWEKATGDTGRLRRQRHGTTHSGSETCGFTVEDSVAGDREERALQSGANEK
ncbi:hypothetical protein E3N88_00922 [Mikania micrantha]|uniref:Uncharacterized protein n=1 Tax=Mikania micrantha TaxID=192012 RepID=A0A5N6Q172_9ASTR|nr:hypothetical protein E3N88_00922 [Mikania micrantha]